MSELHLTPLQQATQAHILRVLAEKRQAAPGAPACYLLADEVGLGKTKIAAGVIRELAAQKKNKPFIVYYLCGSQRVVAQNVAALRRDCGGADTEDVRLSMQLNRNYQGNLLVLPLTPATTFTNLNSEFNAEENKYLTEQGLDTTGPNTVVQSVEDNNLTQQGLDRVKLFLERRKQACLTVMKHQLPPDLVLLDEFQNYNALLYQHLQKYDLFTTLLQKTPYLLLLSATPYQMLTDTVRQLNYRDVLTDVRETNLDTQARLTAEETRFAVQDDNFDALVRFVLDPLHPDTPVPEGVDLYNQVFCRTERSMFYDTEIRDEPVETVTVGPEAAAAHIRRLQAQFPALEVLTKNPTTDRLIAYEKKAPTYPCFATRYTDIKKNGEVTRSGEDDWSGTNDVEYLDWDEKNGGHLAAMSRLSPDSHAKYALLRDQTLPEGAEAMLWVPPVLWGAQPLPGMDRDNPFARNRDYTKVLVFGDYRMTTAAPAWYLRQETERRQKRWTDHPAPVRTLTPAQDQALQQYYESCFAPFAPGASRQAARAFVQGLLEGHLDLIRAVTGLEDAGQACRYYAAMGRLKNVLEEYSFLLRGRDCAQVFASLADCRGVRIKVFGQDPANAQAIRQESERGTGIPLPPCALAERFTEDDTDTNAHKKKHGQQLQARFNSPFWPFVLTASSVAQEGLDFHWYSHAIAHWSLPKNPVEYMQREGRVDRYLSHLVRKRMHLLFPAETSFAALEQTCLEAARRTRPDAAEPDVYRRKRPMYPYWYIGKKDFSNLGMPAPARLPDFRRLVCTLPLSSEAIFWDKLQRALAQYNAQLGPLDSAHPDTARSFCPLLHEKQG